MPTLSPVDYDPFAQAKGAAGVTLTPVDHDPFEQPNAAVDAIKAIPDATANRWSSLIGMGDSGGLYLGPDLSGPVSGPGGTAVKKQIEDVTGPLYKAKTPEGRIYSDTASAFLDPTSYVGPGGPLRAAGSSALASFLGGTAGEATGSPTAAIMASLLSPTFAKSSIASKVAAPLDTVLRKEGGAGSDVVRDMSAYSTNGHFSNQFIDQTLAGLNKDNLHLSSPETMSTLSAYRNRPWMDAKDYDALKLSLNNIDETGATQASKALYDHVNQLTKGQSLSGDVNAFKSAFNDAKGNYAAGMRGQTVEDALDNALGKAAKNNSGLNVGNDIRNSLDPLTKNRDKIARASGYSADEIAKMRQITRGTLGSNALRYGSNLLGGGGGIGSLVSGAIVGGGAGFGSTGGAEGGLGVPASIALGLLMRRGYNRVQLNRVNQLSEMVRARSPLARSMGVVTPQARGWIESILNGSNAKRLLNAAQAANRS